MPTYEFKNTKTGEIEEYLLSFSEVDKFKEDNPHLSRIWPVPVSFIFLVLGLLNSKLLNPLNFVWVKFGELLGIIIAPLVMALIYFIILTPIGLFMRLIGKDLLNTKFSKNRSYWIKREKKIGSMKRQF